MSVFKKKGIMNIRKYFLITDTNSENPNPGDIFIGRGIEYLLREAEAELENIAIFNYVNLFEIKEAIWDRVYDEADYLILAGTPQFSKEGKSHIFDLLPYIKKAKDKGIITAALWVGSGFTNPDYTEDQAIERMFKANMEWFPKYKEAFDLITVRDRITGKLFECAGMKVNQFCDSVFFAANYFGLEKKGNEVNLKVLRNLPGHNEKLVEVLESIELQKDRPTFYLCHSVTDYSAYKNLIKKNLICVNNAKDLYDLYSRANEVVTLRIHGAVPAMNFGKKVMNIKIDSRDNILDYVGMKSTSIHTFEKNSIVVWSDYKDISQIKKADKARFINLWYETCQRKYGQQKVEVVRKYCSEDYWKGTGRSGYGNVPLHLTERIKLILDEVLTLPVQKGLELGCAGGCSTNYLCTKGKDFYGIDISEYAVNRGKERFVANKDRFAVGSIHELKGYGDNQFDIIYSQQVLEHLPVELVPVLTKEISRVTKVGGIILLYLVIGYPGQIARAGTDPDESHITLKTKEWWTKEFAKVGCIPDEALDTEMEKVVSGTILHRLMFKKK